MHVLSVYGILRTFSGDKKMQRLLKLRALLCRPGQIVTAFTTSLLRFRSLFAAVLWALSIMLISGPAIADDWPAWRGAGRDGICREKGLLAQWPPEGPKLLWKATGLGEGYSTPSVAGNLLYVMGNRDGKEWVMALDWTQQAKQVWATPIGPVRHKGNGYPGPRSTPTIDAGRLYTLGINGDLVCLDAGTGREIWRHDLVAEFGGKVPEWGYSESLLVDRDWVLCTPGGKKATILALLKSNGQLIWTSPVGDSAAYSSIIKASITGAKQYVQLTAKGLIGINAADGRMLWRYDRLGRHHANCATSICSGRTIFATSGYGSGVGVLLQIDPATERLMPRELYRTKYMKTHHGGVLLVRGYLYGCNDPGILTCLNYKTGQVMWTDRSSGNKCSLLYADGMLYVHSEDGRLSLVEATPEGFRLKGRFNQPHRSKRQSWPHPVIAQGRLFLRDQDVLLCYDIRAKDK